MAPIPIDPVSTFMTPVRRKIKKVKTHRSSGTLSKQAAIAIAVVVAVVLIAAIILSIVMQRRRKAAKAKRSTVPGYSTESNSGLYGGTPGFFAGLRTGGGHPQPQGEAAHPMNGGAAGQQGVEYGAYGKTGGVDYGGIRPDSGGRGQAAAYYNDGNYSQDMPQRPLRAFVDPSSAHAPRYQ